MKVVSSPKNMHALVAALKKKGKSIGFVPTMGALHEGHLSLIRRAKVENDLVVVSIFVNPTQFSPNEDFGKYPRRFKLDSELCRKEGVDIIFYPQTKDMYSADFKTYVEVEGLSDILCGEHRPGHFRGVATVVTKLFNIVSPDSAYFGQKDAQQAVIIKKFTQDLNIPVKIKVMPIIRDKDGLALSSRNVYLNAQQRKDALVLNQALREARSEVKGGLRDTAQIIRHISGLIKKKRNAKIDYVTVVDAHSLQRINKIKPGTLIALAVWVGKTRLIDNLIIN